MEKNVDSLAFHFSWFWQRRLWFISTPKLISISHKMPEFANFSPHSPLRRLPGKLITPRGPKMVIIAFCLSYVIAVANNKLGRENPSRRWRWKKNRWKAQSESAKDKHIREPRDRMRFTNDFYVGGNISLLIITGLVSFFKAFPPSEIVVNSEKALT